MAFKMKGFPMQSAFKSHPSKTLKDLRSDVEHFKKQVAKKLSPQSDLDWANELVDRYMMNPHDEAS
jgi:hypothetical protein